MAEAMDTAQRGMGLDHAAVRELIRRSAAEARTVGGRIVAGVNTDQLPPGPATLDAVAGAYAEQLADTLAAGARPVLMCSRHRLVRDAGLAVTSLCRGGFFTADDWWDENRRAIEEAATLGTSVLVLVSGGLPDGGRDVDGARRRVADAIAALAPEAAAAGVRLAIEPLHPMFCADRCVIATLGQALDIAERFDPAVVGVVVDAYHVWWDDTVYAQIARAGERIAAFQVADWVTPLPAGALLGRALPGVGCVELRRLRAAVDAAGYTGPVEVEVFDADLWSRPGTDILADTVAAYLAHVP